MPLGTVLERVDGRPLDSARVFDIKLSVGGVERSGTPLLDQFARAMPVVVALADHGTGDANAGQHLGGAGGPGESEAEVDRGGPGLCGKTGLFRHSAP